jgi:hypothetical protein
VTSLFANILVAPLLPLVLLSSCVVFVCPVGIIQDTFIWSVSVLSHVILSLAQLSIEYAFVVSTATIVGKVSVVVVWLCLLSICVKLYRTRLSS